ncbi:hypothetical protein FPQ18DRAFT_301216 [Pyronema domesticum]|nr:hypothetical protein FPQ18DRAFT_301216 [Pyronema domesticum]
MAIGWMKNKLDRSRHVTEEAQLQSTWDYNYASSITYAGYAVECSHCGCRCRFHVAYTSALNCVRSQSATAALKQGETAFLYRDIAYKALAELLRNTRIGTRMDRAEKEEERRGSREFDGRVDGIWDGAEDDDGNGNRNGDEDDDEDDDEDFDVVETELSDEAIADADNWFHGEFRERVEAELRENDGDV